MTEPSESGARADTRDAAFNAVVEAANSYEYDALYRLIEATGREHASEGTTQRTHLDLVATPQPMTSDPSAMRRYTQRFTYDAAGNLTGSTDARGVTTSHDYDALNRRILTRRLAASGVDASEEVRFTWDSNPGAPMPCSNGIGRLCRIDDGASTQHLAYDAFGNLVEKLTVELGQTHRQTYAWDAERRLIASSDGGGSTWLSRDGDGHARTVVTSLSGQPSTLVSLEAMRANGDAGQRVLGNGVTLQRVHDSSGAVQAMIDRVRSVATTPCASPAACAARASGAR